MEDTQSSSSAVGANATEYSVSELSVAIKRVLEEGFGYVRLRGEISGFRGPHTSGHCYFALKDDRARIEAVIWRGVLSRLKIKPEEGMEVIATGKVSAFPASSKYQIVIDALELAGRGAMMIQLEERKKRLQAEGLFDDERKKPRPFLPGIVGVVTSPTGAVIRDILAGFTERFPTRVVIWPVRVQGDGSGAEVANAIRGFNTFRSGATLPRPDVLIVARGGGSLEDLWCFNDEDLVRAVAASTIPIVSAVGHETDWTLIDLAADARAPTPTKAAEWTVPKFSDLLVDLADWHRRLKLACRRRIEQSGVALKAAIRGLPRLDELVALPRQRFDSVDKRLGRALLANTHAHRMRALRASAQLTKSGLVQRLRYSRESVGRTSTRLQFALRHTVLNQRRNLDARSKLLQSFSYHAVLRRGYTIVRDASGTMLRRRALIGPDEMIEIEFTDGQIQARTVDRTKDARSEKAGRAPQSGRKQFRSGKVGGEGQGSLF